MGKHKAADKNNPPAPSKTCQTKPDSAGAAADGGLVQISTSIFTDICLFQIFLLSLDEPIKVMEVLGGLKILRSIFGLICTVTPVKPEV
jgi:hypothetical protein